MQKEHSEGSTYLQALKEGSNLGSGSGAAAAPARSKADPSASATPQGMERRRSARYRCEGTAEMSEVGSDVRTWASFKDISMHGCYVEATATYPVGTHLNLKLAANGFQVNTTGTVRVNYPYLGMGIAFGGMSQDDRTRLKNLLQTLARPSVVIGPGLTASLPSTHNAGSLPLISDATAAIQALARYFEANPTLAREEFLRLIQKS